MGSQTSVFVARVKAALPFPPRSLLTAVLKILPAQRVLPASREVTEPSELLEHIAEKHHLNRKKLLEMVAAQLGVRSQTQLEIPSNDLVLQTGKSVDELLALRVVPQFSTASRSGFVFVAADPAIAGLEALRKKRVPILLGLHGEIMRTWEKYRILDSSSRRTDVASAFPLSPALQFVVRKLAADCQQLGAHEVFVGHPEPTKYECFAQNQVYSGNIHPDVFDKTLQELRRAGHITLEPVDPRIGTIRLSTTRSFEQVVICVTWDGPAQRYEHREQEGIDQSPAEPMIPEEASGQSESTTKTALPEVLEAVTLSSPTLIEPQPVVSPPIDDTELLLIDDDERFSFLLSTILQSKGYKVHRCANGQAALDRITSGDVRPRVIVCDVHMPLLDGPHFIKALRAAGHTQPVLVLTSDEDRLVEAELALLGADAYVQKREDPRVLIAWIKNLIQRSMRQQTSSA